MFSQQSVAEPNIDGSPWLLETTLTPEVALREPSTRTTARARRPIKSFASDLDSMFAEAVAVRRQGAVAEATPAPRPDRDVNRTPVDADELMSGLDNLICDTTGGKVMQKFERAAAQNTDRRKRVTFTYDRDGFARLKAIARDEGTYLKDIISEALNQYLGARQKSTPKPSLS